MTGLAITLDDIATFRSLILSRLGLQFDASKTDQLGDVLRRQVRQTGENIGAYFARLDDDGDDAKGALASLALDLTIPETYFFRNYDQFRVLRDCVLPDRLAAQASVRQLNMLSAGCASGEEAYSIAMTAFEVLADPRWTVSIRAVDINQAALKKARRARYAPWAFRETTPEQQRKWFRAEGRYHVLNEAVARAVLFQETNLATDDPAVWVPGHYDVIFCRNVMMYFSADHAARLVARMARALAPGGYLFLGHAETLRGLSDDFVLREMSGAFYYQRSDRETSRKPRVAIDIPRDMQRASPPHSQTGSSRLGAAAPILPTEPDWYAAIGRSSARISALNAQQRIDHETPRADQAIDMAALLRLIDAGQFTEALTCVRAARGADEANLDLRILEALLLFHAGEVAAAADLCTQIQSRDSLNASSHYILALCREASGAMDEAIVQHRAASYLEPTFAMPHLHTGLIARRTGRRDLARRALGQALDLLACEDETRLALWGGGFGRAALQDICRDALKGCEGRA